MNRRAFLAGVGAGSVSMNSGCLADDGTAGVHTPQVSVVDVSEPGHDLGFDVAITQQFTEDHPAYVELTLRNESEDTLEFQSSRKAFSVVLRHERFDEDASRDERQPETLIILFPVEWAGAVTDFFAVDAADDEWFPDEPTDGCWRAVWMFENIDDAPRKWQLGPDEAVTGRHALLAVGPDVWVAVDGVGECMPDGEYHQQSTHDTWILDEADGGIFVEQGFTLHLEAD